MQPATVLITVTGHDRPGIDAALFAALAAHQADICEVEQSVLGGRLILAAQVAVHAEVAELCASVRDAVAALGLRVEIEVPADTANPSDQRAVRVRHHVTVIGRPLRAEALAAVTRRLTDAGVDIESITQLATEPVCSVELVVASEPEVDLRALAVHAADEAGIDIAVEPSGLRRRAKRLVVLDFDSTLIRDEGIDVLAERAGVHAQVAEITARAMRGELDFAESLRQRVALLAGLPLEAVLQVRDGLRLTPGARTFVRTLRRLGFHVGVVSGGFTVLTERFVAELGLDFAAANELELAAGRLTGRLAGPILDRRGKAEALARFAARYDVPLSQTVAVGDGANDIDMLEAAGLGIAFNAKAALRAAADTAVNVPYLDSVLHVLGISSAEVAEAARG